MPQEQDSPVPIDAQSALGAPATIPLSLENQRSLADALLNPPEPNEALRLAAKMYAGRVKAIV